MENTTQTEAVTIDTAEGIAVARILTIRAGLRLEAKGMKMSRGRSCLSVARAEGLTTRRTAREALVEVNALLATAGF